MSVEIEPGELGFKRPFTKEVSEILYLRNPNSDPVAFKLPSHISLDLGCGQSLIRKPIIVLLQAMKEDPPLDAKCRDKFLVQSVAVSADKEFSNVASIWQDVEKKSKSLIQERKIRVNFLPSEDSHTNGVEPDAEPQLHSSPQGPQFTTPVVQRFGSSTTGGNTSPPSRSEEIKQESPSEPSPETGNVSNVVNSSTRAEPSQSSDDLLSSQLAEARLQIKQLQQQLADNELRQRKKPAEGGELSTGQSSLKQAQAPAQLAAASGVPLQAVAGLCLLSFLLAYIFF
ncbi:MSP domain-containing protein [Microsporum canis CBS 113480]|uniref:MSP domain-containing protein n=1 Tax=Arthroderma otae (strain ATCC MYA-4605 / CBS 113480) TaxID=554155 RepID=C5FF23_ARTOC|nr:MSP domain-containing protein [Microsporum canis CBS 113480]EEQ28317.1 MSP domain-containing protein [Microsporum canis CBS 113480]